MSWLQSSSTPQWLSWFKAAFLNFIPQFGKLACGVSSQLCDWAAVGDVTHMIGVFVYLCRVAAFFGGGVLSTQANPPCVCTVLWQTVQLFCDYRAVRWNEKKSEQWKFLSSTSDIWQLFWSVLNGFWCKSFVGRFAPPVDFLVMRWGSQQLELYKPKHLKLT